MNVLMISPDAPPHKGGISRLVGLLKQGLERHGHYVTIACPTFKVGELKFSTIPFKRFSGQYDLIHLHGPTPFLSDLTLITKIQSRIVYTHHAEVSWLSEKVSLAYRSFHRLLAKRARTIIVHTHDYRGLFSGSNVAVLRLPSPIEPSRKKTGFDPKPDLFTILYVGQFRPFKGLDMIIRAAATLKEVNFVLAGEGYLKEKIINMARGLENVRFVCAKNDEELKQLYRSAHVICLPSVNTTEAYGLVLLEGALFGCVPLASDLIGVAENVSLLKGLTFQTKSLDSLTENIRLLANDKGLWTKLAYQSHMAANDYAHAYTPELYVKKHEEIFKNVCESN